MHRRQTSIFPVLLILVIASCITGCSMDIAPNLTSSGSAATSALGTLQGRNYGGHAPIVGAHVFVLEGYTSASGYGQPAKSLLSAAYSSAYPTAKEPAGTAMAGNYYVTTDSSGQFNISGDYTCDAGYPVYLYAEGGNPQAPGPLNVTSASITNGTGTYAGQYIITITVAAGSLVYQGDSLTFIGSGGNLGNYLNGLSLQALPDANLTTTTFDVAVTSLTNNGVTLTTGNQLSIGTLAAVQTNAPNNPAIVNLAVLGLCPSTGTSDFSYLNYIYMNEVSTVAAAYALGGFFPAPGSSGLAVSGAAAANLSVPQNNSLALLGLQNAALTAGQLYDIQGNNTNCTTTPCDGDTRIARATTAGLLTGGNLTTGSPTVTGVTTTAGLTVGMGITGTGIPAGTTISAIGTNTLTLSANATATTTVSEAMYAGSGNGTVPQALVNTIGNILANCVDSANTSSSPSSQCSLLFNNALSKGTSGTAPIDTASAAIDIAHNPWANVSALVNLPTGNVPFEPSLASANDFSVGIAYTPSGIQYPEGIAIDGKGQIWFATNADGFIYTLNPFGGIQYVNNVGGSPDYIAIDGNGTAWFNNRIYNELQEIGSDGVYVGAYDAGNLDADQGVVVDGTNGTGYVYAGSFLANGNANNGVYKFNANGQLLGFPLDPLNASTNCLDVANSNGSDDEHLAIDNAANGFNLWLSSEGADVVCEINTLTGVLIRQVVINPITGVNTWQPEVPAVDSAGNAWVPNQYGTSGITKIAQNGTVTNPTGGTLSRAFGAAVDGAGNVFVTNRSGNDVTEYLGSTSAAVSSVNFQGGGNVSVFNDPVNIQADPSGNLWIGNFNGGFVVEMLGVAAPTYTPFSVAAYNNKLGSKP